jgi:hypothetical protein
VGDGLIELSTGGASTMISKSRENQLRRAALRKGFLLRKSRRRDRRAEGFGLYVLVDDSAGNRQRGAQAPISEFTSGWVGR